jgi:hypothetical protein
MTRSSTNCEDVRPFPSLVWGIYPDVAFLQAFNELPRIELDESARNFETVRGLGLFNDVSEFEGRAVLRRDLERKSQQRINPAGTPPAIERSSLEPDGVASADRIAADPIATPLNLLLGILIGYAGELAHGKPLRARIVGID